MRQAARKPAVEQDQEGAEEGAEEGAGLSGGGEPGEYVGARGAGALFVPDGFAGGFGFDGG